MERLTFRGENGDGYSLICSDTCQNGYNCSFCERDSEALDKLGAYEDAAEQGLLVRLPCKVGDTIHIIIDGHIFSSEVYHISYSDYYGKLTNTVWTKSGVGARFEDFGKVAFFTREEAVAALTTNAT